MIKVCVADIDGVLCISKDSHFFALNEALKEIDTKYCIEYSEHILKYDGLPTLVKVQKLTQEKGLPEQYYNQVWQRKQELTDKFLKEIIKYDQKLVDIFTNLKKNGYKLYVATNSIRKTTQTILTNLGIINLLDGYYTNEDVKCGSKPHPEMLYRIMIDSCCHGSEMLVWEDSPNGWSSVKNANANLLVVKDPQDLTLEKIMNRINEINNGKENKKKFPFNGNVLIPMCGLSQRFHDAGYLFPKFMLDVVGHKSMIEMVVNSLGIDGNFIYLVRKEHVDKFNLKQMLNLITPNCTIIEVNENTCGAACTALKAEEHINNDKPLIICNCDQYVEFDFNEFAYIMNNSNVSGGILTFETVHPRWSFARVDKDGFVLEVAEKNPISNHGTCGIYYYKLGKEFVFYTKKMIEKELKVNGEYYICPVYQQYVEDGKKIKIYDVKQMIGCGIPEDYLELKRILNNKNNERL